MAAFKIANFQSEVLSRGMAKANRYEVVVVPPPGLSTPDGSLISIMAESAMLPQSRLVTQQQRLFGPPSTHPQYAEYGGDSLTLQFYLDRELKVKKFFDNWIDLIVDRSGGTVSYRNVYVSEGMTIAQLDEQDTETYKVRFTELFPVAVNPVQYSSTQSNQVSMLSVTFSYRRWFRDDRAPMVPPQPSTNSRPNPQKVNGKNTTKFDNRTAANPTGSTFVEDFATGP